MKASIIIRTKNEQKWLGTVLEMLEKQTEKDFETIIVDSGSNDKTLEIAESYSKKLNLKIYRIGPDEFTYPFACNFGASKTSGEYLVFISGHSVPINNQWLKSGLRDFTDEKIAGVYGTVHALPDASIWEKIYYGFNRLLPNKKQLIRKARIGVLGNTNAVIRKTLWENFHFDENLKSGGEDTNWARHYLESGYLIVRDPAFAVYHSHGLGLIKFLKQIKYWHSISGR